MSPCLLQQVHHFSSLKCQVARQKRRLCWTRHPWSTQNITNASGLWWIARGGFWKILEIAVFWKRKRCFFFWKLGLEFQRHPTREQPLKKKTVARIKASRHPNKKKKKTSLQSVGRWTYFPQVFCCFGGKHLSLVDFFLQICIFLDLRQVQTPGVLKRIQRFLMLLADVKICWLSFNQTAKVLCYLDYVYTRHICIYRICLFTVYLFIYNDQPYTNRLYFVGF